MWPYFYAGTMGLVQRDGIDRLRHAMRYSRQHSTFCNTLADAGWLAGVGVKYGVDPREMQDADLIVVWGGNPVNTQVNVMTHIARARKNRGARLVVIDPYRTATAEQADMHLAPRPGTDGALACAVMHILFRDGHADRDYLEKFADCPADLEAHLQSRGPDWAAEITGLATGEIEAFAALYARTERAFIRIGYGFTRSRNGAANLHAVTCIPTVAGKWRYHAGGALYSNGGLYPVDATLIRGLDVRDKSTRLLDQSRIGPILTGDVRGIGNDSGEAGPPVKALFIQNTNPMIVAPESARVRDGFLRDDLFVCVHEQFMTETAAMADIVLPATTFLEHDDMYIGGGHTYLQVARKVIEPLGECRSNHAVLCGLAQRFGNNHPGFRMTEWEIVDATLKASGLGDADTVADGRWIDCAKAGDEMHFRNGFGHPDGKFRFRPDWSRVGRDSGRMPELPDHFAIIDKADDDHPFRLVTAPARNYLNSSFTETPTSQKREGRPSIKLRAEDLDEIAAADGERVRVGNRRASIVVHAEAFDGMQRGVAIIESIWPKREGRPSIKLRAEDLDEIAAADGERVRVGNRRASIVVHAEAFDGMQRGVAIIESIWPNAAFEEGLGVNALVSADPGPPLGGAVYHDTAVWVRPA